MFIIFWLCIAFVSNDDCLISEHGSVDHGQNKCKITKTSLIKLQLTNYMVVTTKIFNILPYNLCHIF
jgi:hypothetical protein